MSTTYEIINSQVIFVYERSAGIRKRQFEFEDSLNTHFRVPFSNFAVADDQDGNIPRFEGVSAHGFSRIQVSQYRTNLITNFNGEFRTDVGKVSDYLSERIPLLKKLLQEEENRFSAFIIELGFKFETEEEINEVLKVNTGVHAINNETNDFSLSYSQPYKEDYFLNIKCSKYTEGKFKMVDGQLIPDGEETTRGISVILDINSKLSHRNKKGYGVEIIDSLEKETFDILTANELKDYLKGDIK